MPEAGIEYESQIAVKDISLRSGSVVATYRNSNGHRLLVTNPLNAEINGQTDIHIVLW